MTFQEEVSPTSPPDSGPSPCHPPDTLCPVGSSLGQPILTYLNGFMIPVVRLLLCSKDFTMLDNEEN